MTKEIILASASKRRYELMHYITDDFSVCISDVDESSDITSPEQLVCELAKRKAMAVFKQNKDAVVIGADTIVYVNGIILGKPENKSEAEKFIRMLSGNIHTVYTGVCIVSDAGTDIEYSATDVTFRDMDEAEIVSYMETGDYSDKAGAYAIQGEAAKYIVGINGCFYNVVGLPVSLVNSLLKKHIK